MLHYLQQDLQHKLKTSEFRVFAITLLCHLILFFMLIFFESKNNSKIIVVGSKKVSFGLKFPKQNIKTQVNQVPAVPVLEHKQQNQAISKTTPKIPVQSSTAKKQEKKAEIPAKSSIKTKKAKAKNKKEKKETKIINQQEPIKQENIIKKEPEIKQAEQAEQIIPEQAVLALAQDNIEFNQADSSYDKWDVQILNSIKDNYAIAPGFEDHVDFALTFELDLNGKPINIEIDKKTSAILNSSAKKAILKAEYPKEKWGKKLTVIFTTK